MPIPSAPSGTRSWWQRQRWLVLRRVSQSGILGLFLLGPWFDIWWVKGNLAASYWFDSVALADPFIVLQAFLAVGEVSATALLGALLVATFFAVVGGRVFCSWVCPVNVITDLAHWTRQRLGIPAGWQPQRNLRWWLLAMSLAVSALTANIAWELVNPVTLVQRGLVFGLGLGWAVIAAVFIFDVLVSRRGWCGHLCPVGAFYGLLGTRSVLRVAAVAREACSDCGDCFEVCPEPQVIAPALRGTGNDTRVVLSGDCTNCARCIDVCPDAVFRFSVRDSLAH
jgi:ferredoxin-type protein NapH